ncbi:zinc finger protein 280C [Lampris incognitus]|uniref:zinc finger protein 280C n=1 Tax=Lampris incognitus TaxID=2546036 RepID=UPI0024B5C46A|nr:zinc finger protein 280C [Lampris incognitus]
MSELFMECEEEELEPWQKQVVQVNLVDDDDDDEPIFVGELISNQSTEKAIPPPVQRTEEEQPRIASLTATPTRPSTQIVLSSNVPGKGVKSVAPSITTIMPQPVIVNNQGFIVSPPQLPNAELIASLGKQYPPGTSFTILPAGLQRMTPAKIIPGVVHRPQVQQINNNIVTLSNVQSPVAYSMSSNQLQTNRPNSQPIQIISLPVKAHGNSIDQNGAKRGLPPLNDISVKKAKLDMVPVEPSKVTDPVENGTFRKKCPKCSTEFLHQETMKCHMMSCCPNLMESVFPANTNSPATAKRIMLVSDFYYGRFEGEWQKRRVPKTNTTFKCQSCLKVLKNNIRFMNHMKHHLELEKQNSESWESHTTCQHCYRQYTTPFQLQCHIESAHSPFESSTICKICELAFESEQVLLEHMKDNHKPGEMPYICRVCNYRSSFFCDVETHFRSAHENTKDLLCPFCLKVLRSSHSYLQHYMRHQKKGIHRCGKCRLNFLTYKERVDHKTHYHKTFKKPKALEGLPPGTKVTIRASFTGKSPTTPDHLDLNTSPEVPTYHQQNRAHSNVSKTKLILPAVMKATSDRAKKQERRISKHNLSLRNLRTSGGHYTCIECDTKIHDFFDHYPIFVNCGACKYRTSCKISIGNHMIRFHSAITKDRFMKMKNRKGPGAWKFGLSCLNCNLFMDGSRSDLMTKHLAEHPNHTCKVIHEKDTKAPSQRHLALGEPSKVLLIFRSAPAEGLKNIAVKQVEKVDSGSVLLVVNEAAVHQPKGAAEQKVLSLAKGATETTAVEGQQTVSQSSPPSLPSSASGTSDKGLVLSGASSNSEVREPVTPPVTSPSSLTVLKHDMAFAPIEAASLSSQSKPDDPLAIL